MKCPHCGYVHGWDDNTRDSVHGKEGDFYELPVKMERTEFYHAELVHLYACPSCKKTFID